MNPVIKVVLSEQFLKNVFEDTNFPITSSSIESASKYLQGTIPFRDDPKSTFEVIGIQNDQAEVYVDVTWSFRPGPFPMRELEDISHAVADTLNDLMDNWVKMNLQ